MEKNLEKIWEESKKFKIQQKKKEWLDFLKRLNNVNTALEIGCYDGGTTVSLSAVVNRLITIDQPLVPRFDTHRYEVNGLVGSELLNSRCDFTYIGGNSHSKKTFDMVNDLLDGEKLDLLFIDGDHSYNGVKQDFYMYTEMVKDGGIVAMHDTHRSDFHEKHGCFVHNFWDEIKKNYEHEMFYDDKQYHEWGGIGFLIYKK